LSLALQRAIARVLSPVTTLAVYALVRGWLRVSLADPSEARRVYRALRRERVPLLVCANHLTMIDSALIAWALAPPGFYLRDFSALPWNLPEQTLFASTWPRRALAYVFKCLPIVRGGSRSAVADTIDRFIHLLGSGEAGLLFPEGGRSRSGRVEVERAAYGVGRVVKSLPGCRVLCVYLRGEAQHAYSNLPARGDRLHVRVATIEPKSDHAGLRGSREIARQIAARLAELEVEHFDGRA
jgi:1-acyl-sn-glycerol-3-phosphate acyltransferase